MVLFNVFDYIQSTYWINCLCVPCFNAWRHMEVTYPS